MPTATPVPTPRKDKTFTIYFRLPKNLKARLEAEADENFRSIPQHMTAILVDHFRRQDIEREIAARLPAKANA